LACVDAQGLPLVVGLGRRLKNETEHLTSFPPLVLKGCRLRGKGRDSSCETAMPGRENVDGSVDVTVMCRSTIAANPLSYSKTSQALRASALFTAAAGLG
jgi:hypothetical protein